MRLLFIINRNISNFILGTKLEVEKNLRTKLNYKSLKGGFEITNCLFDEKNCENDFDWYFSYKYGYCYQFNTGFNSAKLKTLKSDDSESGIKLFIFLLNFNKCPIFRSNGLKVFIHNQSSYPENSKGVLVKHG